MRPLLPVAPSQFISTSSEPTTPAIVPSPSPLHIAKPNINKERATSPNRPSHGHPRRPTEFHLTAPDDGVQNASKLVRRYRTTKWYGTVNVQTIPHGTRHTSTIRPSAHIRSVVAGGLMNSARQHDHNYDLLLGPGRLSATPHA